MTPLVDIMLYLESISVQSKYLKLYKAIIFNRISNPILDGEKHHIVPVSICRKWRLEKSNIVRLSPREHFIVHQLLIRILCGSNRIKMISAIFLLTSRTSITSSKMYSFYRKSWSEYMHTNNPLFSSITANKIRVALTGRTKETHEYIAIAALKKASYTIDNCEWLRKSRDKFKLTVKSMSLDERKRLFGHTCTLEQKRKFSNDRKGRNKNVCPRTMKMSLTKRANNALLTPEEVRKKHSKTTGMKWYHNDLLKQSKLLRNSVNGWNLGRKFYENN